MADGLDTVLGAIFCDDVELELGKGVNFVAPLHAEPNTSTGLIDVTLVGDTGGGGGALASVYYVDGSVATEGSGSIGAPYKTIAQGLTEHGAGGVFYLAPFDYSAAEPTLTIPASKKVQLIGLGLQGPGTPFEAWQVKIGGITQASGGEQGYLVLQNLQCAGNLDIGVSLLAIDCFGMFIEGQGADKGNVDLRGGSVSGVTCSALTVRDCAIGSSAAIAMSGTSLPLVNCSFEGAKPDVTFSGSAGVVSYDRVTLFRAGGGTVCNSVTNGTQSAF